MKASEAQLYIILIIVKRFSFSDMQIDINYFYLSTEVIIIKNNFGKHKSGA